MSVRKAKVDLKKRNRRIIRWAIYSIIYAIVYGILVGTFTYYFGTISLGIGIYMDVPWVFIMIGLSGWALMIYILYKGKSFSLGG